jgi:hypothetical protein
MGIFFYSVITLHILIFIYNANKMLNVLSEWQDLRFVL